MVRCIGSVCSLVLIALLLVATRGCGDGASGPRSRARRRPSADVSLPDWAPEHASQEFLRAARILKPMPREVFADAAQGEQAREVFYQRLISIWPATYELFGSLTDDQIDEFRTARKVYVPIKSLSTKQREALDRWFDAWRSAAVGRPPPEWEWLEEDYLVLLYKMGAKEDLSNVDVGFDVPEGAPVHMRWQIVKPDGSMERPGITFALFD